MSTIAKSTGRSLVTMGTRSESMSRFWEMAEFNRFGIICFLLGVVACFTGITAGLFAGNDLVQLTLVTVPAMLTLALTLALAPMRWLLAIGTVSVLVNLLVIVI